MSFALKPDYQRVRERYQAFWHGEIVDRALVSLRVPATAASPVPTRSYPSQRDRWLDVEFRAEADAVSVGNYQYLGDALPIVFPNMGPEIFSGWCGCGYEFGETTTWSVPCIRDWERDYDRAVLDPDHPLLKLTMEYTLALLERAAGRFIVGLTDFHPGGDHLAALRDPQVLAVDMIENRDWVVRKLTDSYPDYYRVYDLFYQVLRKAGMPITSWAPLIHDGPFYIPSNDFSCMISTEMFTETFLPGIIEECRFFQRSIYHLDGPGALHHLDTLLEIPELDAIQWVPGAGNMSFPRWIDVYRKVQQAGKSLQVIDVTVDDLDLLFESLSPEGVWLSQVGGVDDAETAEAVLKRISRWTS